MSELTEDQPEKDSKNIFITGWRIDDFDVMRKSDSTGRIRKSVGEQSSIHIKHLNGFTHKNLKLVCQLFFILFFLLVFGLHPASAQNSTKSATSTHKILRVLVLRYNGYSLPAYSRLNPALVSEPEHAGLSPDNISINYTPSLWHEYRWAIVLIGVLLLAQFLLITMLLIQRRRRKLTEETLHEKMLEYSAIFERSVVGKAEADPATGRFLKVNQAFADMTGYSPEELYRITFTDITHPDDREHDSQGFELMRTGSADSWHIEKRYLKKDGAVIWVAVAGNRMRFNDGRPDRAIAVIQDITKRKMIEAEREQISQQRQLALDAARMGWWRYDPITCISYWDDRYKDIFDVTGYSGPNDEILARLHPDDLPNVWAKVEAALDPDNPQPYSAEYRINFFDGSIKWIEAHGLAYFGNINGVRQATSFVGTVSDITERKKAEEALKASLNEKKVLLKEIHHRVKNNMQVISSLVSLQADHSADSTIREVLREVSYRVRSMALVHEKLYQSTDLSRIDFAQYAEGLLNYLWRSYGNISSNIRLKKDMEPVWLPVNEAVPLGLILNELISNALKHAFPDHEKGEVAVILKKSEQKGVILCVHDHGKGLPAGFNWKKSDSLGLRLVQMLIQQLHADVKVVNDSGTEFKIILGRNTT